MQERYYVKETDVGFVICDINKALPLPFIYFKKRVVEADCAEFNKYGSIAVASHFYKTKAAGNRHLADYKYAYEKWLVENYKNFV